MWKVKKFPNMCTSPVIPSRLGCEYRSSYSPTAMTNAYFKIIDENMSIRGAARKYGVPEATLRDRLSGRVAVDTVKSGTEPLFSLEEEAKLCEHLKSMESYGYGYSRAEVVDLASIYAVELGKRDADHPLTLMWFRNYMKRWPELKINKPRSLEMQRAKATSEENVNRYFKELEKILTKYDLKSSPERIYNVDEKGLKQDHTPPNTVGASDSERPSAVVSGKGSTITVIGSGNALGHAIPPYFIFPGQRMRQELLNGSTPGVAGTVSESGWSNSHIFQTYLADHFSKYVSVTIDSDKPIILLYDGHRSHLTLPLIDWATQHNIILFVLPAHTSHVLQPLDVGCFGPFQKIYNSACHKYMRENNVRGIDRYSICELACKSYLSALKPQNLQSAFRKSGIYPFNPDAVDKSNFIPAKAFKRNGVNNADCSEETGNGNSLATGAVIAQDDVNLPVENASNNEAVDDSPAVSSKRNDKVISSGQQENITDNFFHDIEDKLGRRAEPAKKRRCLSFVVSGKSITEEETRKKIEEHQEAMKPKSAKSKTSKKRKTVSEKKSKQLKPKSSKSAISSSPQPGPSCINISADNTPDFSSDEEVLDSEKCCVCNLFQPVELARSDSVYFTQWGQCMYATCQHWTHLKYCCPVKRLRSRDTFYCPCHGVPCMPEE